MTVPLTLDTFYTLSHCSVSIVDVEHVNVCQNIDISFVEHSDGVYCVAFKNYIFLVMFFWKHSASFLQIIKRK